MPRCTPRVPLLVTLLTASACAVEPPLESIDGTIASDSAAAPLVEFARLPQGPGPLRIAARPSFRLGGLYDNDSLEFDPRAHLPVVALVDGTIVVGDHQRLKFYAPDGTLLRIAGRYGYGPGEFDSIRDLCPQADTTLAVIDGDGRWSVWNRQGQLLHAHEREGVIPNRACSASGDLLVLDGLHTVVETDGRRRAPYTFHRLDGTPRLTIGPLSVSEYFVNVLFIPAFTFHGQSLLIGDSRTFALQEVSIEDGRTLRRWYVHGGMRPMSQAVYDSIVESGFPRDASADQRKKTLARAAELGNPGVFPAFFEVRYDPAGRIWINPAFERWRWYVIDRQGMRLSLVTLPMPPTELAKLEGFTDRHVVIHQFDADGAPILSFHSIEERAPAQH